MTNYDFVQRHSTLTNEREKRHGSLYYNDGVLYSYGYHYPLLFKIDGKYFVNTAWYSRTTSKHIGYAKRFADYEVKLHNVRGKPTKEQVLQSLENERTQNQEAIHALKRRGTQKEHRLINEAQIIALWILAL